MMEEQDRHDDIQKLVEDCISELRNSESECSKPAAGLFSRVKFVLKKEREWIRKIAIDGIQEKVAKLKQQLNGSSSRTVNESNNEDFNVFEVEHNNICHTALVYNDDGDEVDKHEAKEACQECKSEPPEDTEMLPQGGEYFECKQELPEDTEVLSKGGEYIESKLEPQGDARGNTIKQEALGDNTLYKQELGLDEERAKCSIQEKFKGSEGSPPCKNGRRCTYMKDGVCKYDHTLSQFYTKYPKFKTKKQCFRGELCGIPDCAFRHKRDEKFSHSKGSHSVTSQGA